MASSLCFGCFVKQKKQLPTILWLAAFLLVSRPFCPTHGQNRDSLFRREALLTQEAERYVTMALDNSLLNKHTADSLMQSCRTPADTESRLAILQSVIHTVDNLYESVLSSQQGFLSPSQQDKTLGRRMLPYVLTMPEGFLTSRERQQIQENEAIRRLNDNLAESVALPEPSTLDFYFLHIAHYFFNNHPENYGKTIPMMSGATTILIPEMPRLPSGKETSTHSAELSSGSKVSDY